MTSAFGENFWNHELGDHAGFDKVVQYMNDGTQSCSLIMDVLKQRTKMEESYANKLSKLASHTDIITEGSLGKSWAAVCESLEVSSECHKELAQSLKEHMEALNDFIEPIRLQRNGGEQNVRKLQQELKTGLQRTMSSKSNYNRKCEELIALKQMTDVHKNDPNKQKDVEKNKKKVQNLSRTVNDCQKQYKTNVDNLESVRSSWVKTTENALRIFQDTEIERIQFLRRYLWRLTNIESNACTKIDRAEETVRKVLEKCHVSTDMRQWVANNATGSKRPGGILYEEHPKRKERSSSSSTAIENKASKKSVTVTNESAAPSNSSKLIKSLKGLAFRSQDNPAVTAKKCPEPTEDKNKAINMRYSMPPKTGEHTYEHINYATIADPETNEQAIGIENVDSNIPQDPMYATIKPKFERRNSKAPDEPAIPESETLKF